MAKDPKKTDNKGPDIPASDAPPSFVQNDAGAADADLGAGAESGAAGLPGSSQEGATEQPIDPAAKTLMDSMDTTKGAPPVLKDDAKKPEVDPVKPFVTRPGDVTAAQDAFPDMDTVTMTIPRDVRIQHAAGKIVIIKAGIREVPVELSTHPYLLANGATEYKK
jgi:hypothetical protein